jgi:hypothetical protein
MRTLALYLMLIGLASVILGLIHLTGENQTLPLFGALAGGVLTIFCGLRLQKGWRTGLFLALILFVGYIVFGGRDWLVEDHGFMPGGFLGLASALGLLFVFVILVQPRERKRDF